MGGVKDTKQNLQAAIEGEGYEFKEMYPGFIKEAEAEGNKAAVISFRNANAVEKTHYDLYSKALEVSGDGEGFAARLPSTSAMSAATHTWAVPP